MKTLKGVLAVLTMVALVVLSMLIFFSYESAWAQETSSVEKVVFSFIRQCDKTSSYRAIKGDVPEEIDLSDDAVARQILEKAAYFALQKCPGRYGFDNINVYLCKSGEEIRNCSVVARNYDKDKLTWFEYKNRALESRIAKEEAKRWAEIKRAEEAIQKSQEERRKREMEARKTIEEPKKVESLEEKFRKVHGKSIPAHIKEVVFGKTSFFEPIKYTLPEEDDPLALEKLKLRADKGWGGIISVAESIDRRFLKLLEQQGLAKIERGTLKTRYTYPYGFLYYSENIRPFIYEGDFKYKQRAGTFKVRLASRALKSVDYINEYEANLGGVKIKFFALTFSYDLKNEFPGLPKIEKTFEGKAKAYLDPDDGKWKIDSMSIGDRGDTEFIQLLK